MIRLAVFVVVVVSLALAGCMDDKKMQEPEFKNEKKGDPDHSDHDSGPKQLEDVELPGGKKGHAGLMAHLSKKGDHELDVFFETFDKKPVPIPVAKMTASVIRRVGGKAEDKAYRLEFVPAPKDERKGDPEGQCSHFVAEAKWMKPGDELDVTLTYQLDGKNKTVPWSGFNPKKYGHEGD